MTLVPWFRTDPSLREPHLDPKLARLLERPDVFGEDLEPATLRDLFDEAFGALPRLGERIAGVEDVRIPVTGGDIPLRVYRPEGRTSAPLVLYLHGGGWTAGSVESHDDLCRSLCHRAGAVLVSVGYRLAPEHPFPLPLDDCQAALAWCVAEAAALGGDPARLILVGDSAGGNLAAGLALRARDLGGPPVCGQVLLYPALAYDFTTESYQHFAHGFGLTRAKAKRYWDNYTSLGLDAAGPYASPLLCDDLGGLPAALVVTAHFDPVRDDGETYAAKLRRAEVPVRCTRYVEVNHAFLHCAAFCAAASRALDEIAAAIRGFASCSGREERPRTRSGS